MQKLNDNWITEKHIDFEYKKYVLLAYFQEVSNDFNGVRLYPVLSDLITHYRNTLAFKENKGRIANAFPKRISSIDIDQAALQTVGTLRTVISQIKSVLAGESVGYSRRGVLDHDARIATLAIGYADGYDRRLGNGIGDVWVNGTRCPTVGNVCMDMTMIDVTAASATEGDEVIIFGPELPITELAQRIETIPYEILTGVSERVKRVFFKEGN